MRENVEEEEPVQSTDRTPSGGSPFRCGHCSGFPNGSPLLGRRKPDKFLMSAIIT